PTDPGTGTPTNPGTGTPVPVPEPVPVPLPEPDPDANIIKDSIITSVVMKDKDGNNIEDIRPDQGSRVQVDFTWQIPAGHPYSEGATFTFPLPDKFRTDRNLTGDLNGGYGTYEVTTDGTVTFIFSDAINDGAEINDGTFYVWREFDEKKFEGGTRQEIDFKFDGIAPISVHFKGKNNNEIDKNGKANKGMNPSYLDWTVDFNQSENPIKGAIFTDELPSGLDIDMSSIKVFPLEVQLNGSVNPKAEVTTFTPEKLTEGNGFKINFGDIDGAYRVAYKTNVTGTTDTTYTNKATVTGTNLPKDLIDSANVSVRFSQPLNKKAIHYDYNKQTITWAIQYNYNEKLITQSDAWLEDRFDTSHQELVSGSFTVHKMTIGDNGNGTKDGAAITEYNVTPSPTGFRLQFDHDVSAAYEITYQTKAKNRVHQDSYLVKNEVEIYDGTKKDASREINQAIFWKNAKKEKVNYLDKTIEWTLSLNDDNQVMDEVVITDSYAGQGLTLLPDKVKINDWTKDLEEGPDKDYSISPNSTYEEGFKITFHKPVTKGLVITYLTKFDPTSKDRPSVYKNKAELNWKENGKAQDPITKSATVKPDNYTNNNGNKTGTYDARTKEITWTIDVNYNLHKINNAIIRDFYTGEQTFVKDSLTIHKLLLTGGADGVKVVEGPVVATKFDELTNGFELHLGPIDSAYRITYKTSLANLPVGEVYENNATMHDSDITGTPLYKGKTTVRPTYGGQYVLKTGVQGTGADSEYATWTVRINPSQSHISAGAVLTDTLSSNQLLMKDSFKLFTTTVSESGALTIGKEMASEDYKLEVVGNTFKLTFKNDLHTAYILEYRSFINADHGEIIKNEASFAGKTVVGKGKDGQEGVKVSLSGAGGGASTPGKGDLKIVKTDADTKKALAGATFGLYDKAGKTLLETVVTDENGMATFKGYKFKAYKLKELSAPVGYVIADEYRNGKDITLKAPAGADPAVPVIIEITIDNKLLRQGFELTKVDAENAGKALEGAVFNLQVEKGGAYETIAELTTGSDGKVSKGDLAEGNYQLVETKAPKGYKLDATPISFKIASNQTEIVTLTKKNTKNIGSVQLLKVDHYTKEPLPGVTFELQDADGKVLQSGLTTDKDGILLLENLKAGFYQLVETKALAGYELAEPLKFEVTDEGTTALTLTNRLIPGSVKLTKIRKGYPNHKLTGAEFTLRDENGQVTKDKNAQELTKLTTDANGELLVEGLNPGKYEFVETKAPTGYVINSKPIAFEIKRNQVVGEHVLVTAENDVTSGGGG
ncbi:hypothetical protein C7R92_31695, partial [Brevibacillus porteri]